MVCPRLLERTGIRFETDRDGKAPAHRSERSGIRGLERADHASGTATSGRSRSLEARRGGPAERSGRRSLGRAPPGARLRRRGARRDWPSIAALSIGLGLLVTGLLEHAWGIGNARERVNVWLAAHRTPTRTDASLIGSIVAGGVVLPIIVGSIALVCALLRQWRIAAFVVFALAVESATYRATTLVVHSHRPRVVRLEDLPVNASYPSGHTARLDRGLRRPRAAAHLPYSRAALFRAFAWTLAVAMVAFVAHVAHVSRHAPSARRRRRRRRRHRGPDRGRLRLPGGRRGRRGTAAGVDATMKVAVIAHAGKTLGGGLPELRRVLEAEGVADPLWCEVPKSRKAPAAGRAGARRGRRAGLRLGRRRDGPALRRRARRLDSRASRSFPPGPRTCSRRTSGSPRTSRRRSRSGCAASAAGSTSAASTASGSPSWPAPASTRR